MLEYEVFKYRVAWIKQGYIHSYDFDTEDKAYNVAVYAREQGCTDITIQKICRATNFDTERRC